MTCRWCSFCNCIDNYGSKYLFLVFWTCINVLTFYNTYAYYKYSPEYYYLHEILGVGLCLSRATSNVINLNISVLLLPMCRSLTSALRLFFGEKVPLRCFRILVDRCKGFHILCAWTLVMATAGHITGHVLNAKNYSDHYDVRFPTINAASRPHENPVIVIFYSVPGITGLILLLILLTIVSTAIYSVRSAHYEYFWYTHRLFILFYIVVLFHAIRGVLKRQINVGVHVPGCIYLRSNTTGPVPDHGPVPEHEPIPELLSSSSCDVPPQFDTIGSSTWIWLALPLTIYMADVLYRIAYKQAKTTEIVDIKNHKSVFEVQLRQAGFSCRPCDYVLIQCPEISTFEWHPYTVVKVQNDTFTVYIKRQGDWSGKILEKFNTCFFQIHDTRDSAQQCTPGFHLYVDGPFASPMEDVLRYKISICIAGGIGITPFLSVLNRLKQIDSILLLERLHLIWICKTSKFFEFASAELKGISSLMWSKNRPDLINIQLYVTRSKAMKKLIDNEQACDSDQTDAFLRNRVKYGRPDIKSTVKRITKCHAGQTIAVFSCGPRSLVRSVERGLKVKQYHGTTLHFYHESF